MPLQPEARHQPGQGRARLRVNDKDGVRQGRSTPIKSPQPVGAFAALEDDPLASMVHEAYSASQARRCVLLRDRASSAHHQAAGVGSASWTVAASLVEVPQKQHPRPAAPERLPRLLPRQLRRRRRAHLARQVDTRR